MKCRIFRCALSCDQCWICTIAEKFSISFIELLAYSRSLICSIHLSCLLIYFIHTLFGLLQSTLFRACSEKKPKKEQKTIRKYSLDFNLISKQNGHTQTFHFIWLQLVCSGAMMDRGNFERFIIYKSVFFFIHWIHSFSVIQLSLSVE